MTRRIEPHIDEGGEWGLVQAEAAINDKALSLLWLRNRHWMSNGG